MIINGKWRLRVVNILRAHIVETLARVLLDDPSKRGLKKRVFHPQWITTPLIGPCNARLESLAIVIVNQSQLALSHARFLNLFIF